MLEVEQALGYGFILLDVLMDQHENVSRTSKSIDDVLESFQALKSSFPYLNTITARKLFSECKEAQESLSLLPFPCDGLVAVPTHGVDVKKIKEEKSMELKLSDDGVLETAEGHRLLKHPSRMDKKDIGNSYEIKFVITGGLNVKRVTRRPDKLIPNSYEAVRSIVSSSKATPTRPEVSSEL